MWLYRIFRKSDGGSTVTVKSGVTLETNAQTVGGLQTTTGAATAGVGTKIFKCGTGAGPTIDFIIGAGFTAAGPTPAYIGSFYINTTTGKAYLASGTSATSDWKLVTSA